jgi:hypothetical protein
MTSPGLCPAPSAACEGRSLTNKTDGSVTPWIGDLDGLVGREPTPELAAMLAEQYP